MKWTEVPAGELHAAEQRIRVALGDKASDVVNRVNTDPAFVNLMANQIVGMTQKVVDNQLTSLNEKWLRARKIMGKNFFGVEEAIKHFGVNPTYTQLAALSEIPFSEAALEQLKDTHVLVAVFPLSILEIRGKVQDKGLFFNQDWYNEQSFAKEPGEASWQLVRKTPVDDSFLEKWQDQQGFIGKDEEVPTAQVMVYTIIGYYLAISERLFENIYVRTSSKASGGDRVLVGAFDSRGLDVFYDSDDSRSDDLGLVSSRKS